MNCPVRTEPFPGEGHNQNPPELAPELTTRRSLNSKRSGLLSSGRINLADASHGVMDDQAGVRERNVGEPGDGEKMAAVGLRERSSPKVKRSWIGKKTSDEGSSGQDGGDNIVMKSFWMVRNKLTKYVKFIGPGFMVAVAYIDPGNYATDVAAGASFRYRLLFIILLSNLFAIFLQSLCIKLGTVTGMNLAENCKAHLPRWLNYVLYAFAEAAIIATDISEVIGTAIALNILLKVPLVAGCAISIVDVLVILVFYNPTGMSMRALRTFEIFVILLVLGVAICFAYELSKIKDTSVGEVFKGYLPSKAIVSSKGLYQSCGILGATVMPHSLYLGSGIVQARLREFDNERCGQGAVSNHTAQESLNPRRLLSIDSDTASETEVKYRPSLAAIRSCLAYSITELALALITFALFVNSAILIVSGASLSKLPKDQTNSADLFSIHALLSSSIAPVAGTIFALALLLSGTSAGIVCTIAGQMVSEGQLSWTVRPWIRRLATRTISIVPSIIIAGAVGREGLGAALEGSQVALSIVLPFVSAPLIYFTWNARVMTVAVEREDETNTAGSTPRTVDAAAEERGVQAATVVVMNNSWLTNLMALLIWGVLVVMNVALLVLLGMGRN